MLAATFGSGSRCYQALGGMADMRNCGSGRAGSAAESFAGPEIEGRSCAASPGMSSASPRNPIWLQQRAAGRRQSSGSNYCRDRQ